MTRYPASRPAPRSKLLLAAATLCAAAAPAAETRWSLGAQLEVGNDGNFQRRATTNDDDRTVGSVGLDLRLDQRRTNSTLHFALSPRFRRDLEDSSVRSDHQRLELGYEHVLSPRTKWRAGVRGERSDGADSFEGVEDLAVLTGPSEHFSHHEDLTLTRDLSARTGMVFGLEHAAGKYEARDLSDSQMTTGSVAWKRRLAAASEVRATARGRLLDLGSGRSTEVEGLTLGLRRRVGRFGELNLEAGGFRAHGPQRLAGADFGAETTATGWSGAGDYRHSNRSVAASLRWKRDVSPGIGLGHATLADDFSVTIATVGGQHVRFDLSGAYTRHSFLLEEAEAPATRLRSRRGTARLHWIPTPDVRCVFAYTRVRQASDVPELDDLDFPRYSVAAMFPLYRSGPRIEPG